MNLQSTKKPLLKKDTRKHPDLLSIVTAIKSSFELGDNLPPDSIKNLEYYLTDPTCPEPIRKKVLRVLNYLTQERFKAPDHKDDKIYVINNFYQTLSQCENNNITIFKNNHPKEYPYSIN